MAHLQKADFVCCIDVLEHVEEIYTTSVLEDLKKIIVKFGYISISTGPAQKTLEDGRNAHLVQRPKSWWVPLICEKLDIEYLENIKTKKDEKSFVLIVKAKNLY